MTRLAERKTRLTFETEETVRSYSRPKRGSRNRPRQIQRQIIIETDHTGYGGFVRLKGARVRMPFSWQGVYEAACRVEAERRRRERKQRRKRL